MDIAELNQVSANAFPPRKNWEELEVGQQYMITTIRKVDTKYGKRMVFTVNEEFQLFVPARVSNKLYEDSVLYENLAAKANKMELFFLNLGHGKFKFMV